MHKTLTLTSLIAISVLAGPAALALNSPPAAHASRRPPRGVQGQLGLHSSVGGTGGATQIAHSLSHSVERTRSLQRSYSQTRTASVAHSTSVSRSISHERSRTLTYTGSHTLTHSHTHSADITAEHYLLCAPGGACPKSDTQAYEWGMCTPAQCPGIHWRAVAAWRRAIRRRGDAAGSAYARRAGEISETATVLWPRRPGTVATYLRPDGSIGRVTKIEGTHSQMQLRMGDGSLWAVTRLPTDRVSIAEIR